MEHGEIILYGTSSWEYIGQSNADREEFENHFDDRTEQEIRFFRFLRHSIEK
ncbi:hypothetical protein MPTA7396_6960 [Mycoplasmoides pneumoniae]|uniref:hypothetical protein n=1 Tax=Mycoplasmoides pneumoniae TaxID=2104 RepID=UPI001364A03F|nr:hypothetical protein [Mycoplasmoides pneumoniae]GLL57390.1 hypothetical protein KPI25BX_1520 [Mycoplasmoides pneumoniae]GLL58108.1 hypothetical protein Y1241N_1550 [Mycoplasmoides pneumoniae]GLL58825.1 hypothetical protein Y12242BV_1490 [Mycoplasmoides pneumoniae]GLL59590.1 hypothetical protein Y12382J_1960 [Mycoplasmoides pneumoniae]GLL60267.1 hypothetical protein OA571N_1490 [Mycoplasmoides pneumoniae]